MQDKWLSCVIEEEELADMIVWLPKQESSESTGRIEEEVDKGNMKRSHLLKELLLYPLFSIL